MYCQRLSIVSLDDALQCRHITPETYIVLHLCLQAVSLEQDAFIQEVFERLSCLVTQRTSGAFLSMSPDNPCGDLGVTSEQVDFS